MKLTCTQENFKKAVLNTERVVSKQTTLPILNNILFETEKGRLRLSATNLEVGVIAEVNAKVEKEGKITIPAKVVGNFINNLPSGDNLTLESDSQNLKIKTGSFRATIKGLSAEDFPLIPKKSVEFQLRLQGGVLRDVINKVMISIALNEVRQELTGINVILLEKELLFASTDSFRLSEVRIALKEEDVERETYNALIGKKSNVIIPAATAVEVSRIISNNKDCLVEITIEDGQIFFNIDGVILVSRLINGKYPEYKHIMPSEFKTRIVGERNELQSAVKLANVFTSGKTSEIALKIDAEEEKTIIEARSVEAGENTSELKLDSVGPSQEVILNAKYLLDGINAMKTSKIAVLVNSGSSPIALREIREDNGEVVMAYTYIVMPIKN